MATQTNLSRSRSTPRLPGASPKKQARISNYACRLANLVQRRCCELSSESSTGAKWALRKLLSKPLLLQLILSLYPLLATALPWHFETFKANLKLFLGTLMPIFGRRTWKLIYPSSLSSTLLQERRSSKSAGGSFLSRRSPGRGWVVQSQFLINLKRKCKSKSTALQYSTQMHTIAPDTTCC